MTELNLPRVTLSDPTLTHQVYFGVKERKTVVTCNCRRVKNKLHGNLHANWIGQSANLDEARELYNNPANHFLPFGEEDKAKW